jgi:hypothetical protein
VRAKTGEVPYRIELTCRKKSSHCRDPHSWLRTSASHINFPANDHADMSFEVSRHERFPDTQKAIHISKLADSSASEMVARNTSFHPSSEPTLSRGSFYALFRLVLPKLHGGKSDLGQKGSRRSTNESIITNIREEKKGPRRGHSRTFYPRPARSRSPFRPTSQVEHHH